jgi:hypothetical protein
MSNILNSKTSVKIVEASATCHWLLCSEEISKANGMLPKSNSSGKFKQMPYFHWHDASCQAGYFVKHFKNRLPGKIIMSM